MDGICDCLEIGGCQDSMACNYDELAIEPGTCDFAVTYFDCDGICLDDTDGDGVCDQLEITGCTDLTALNYNPDSTDDDESCMYLSDCDCCGGFFYFDPNPNPYCEEHCASMIPLCFEGCLDPNAINYSLDATEAPISCIYNLCSDPNYLEYYFNPTEIDLETINTVELCGTPITSIGLTVDMFTDPINTGANMTLPMPGGLLEQFAGGQIAAFMGDICVGLESITTGFIAMGLWGDDSSTEFIDGLLASEVPTFAVLYNGGVISLDQNELTGYQTNGIETISNFQFTEPIGCTNPAACNYLSYALIDDGSCILQIEFYNCNNSCINDTDNDGICNELEIPGCTIWGYNNYNELATDNDGSCMVSWQEDYSNLSLSSSAIIDSIETDYTNYITNSTATIDSLQAAYDQLDGLSISIDLLLGWNIIGYTNSYEQDAEEALFAIEDLIEVFKDNNADVYMPEYGFNGIGNLLPGQGYQIKVSEAYNSFSFENSPTFGCTDESAFNYTTQVNTDDGTCITIIYGCTLVGYFGYNPDANTDDGSCVVSTYGCTNDSACNYATTYNTDDASCIYAAAENLDCNGVCLNDADGDEVCDEYEILGCTYEWAFNFNPIATEDDGSCVEFSYGCIDPAAYNYNPFAANDDGSCEYCGCCCMECSPFDPAECDNIDCQQDYYCFAVLGCMDIDADNYNIEATQDDGSCFYVLIGCSDSDACNYNEQANTDDGSCSYAEQGYDCEGSITAEIGDVMEGGIVFYIDESGEHGLVAALEDITQDSNMGNWGTAEGFEWGCMDQNIIGADGTGYQNTLDIVAQNCQTQYGGITAAQAAVNYSSEGYTDWFLPSNVELHEMYSTIGSVEYQGNTGGFELSNCPYYWSSSENDSIDAWNFDFINGNYLYGYGNKLNSLRVRAVRAF